MYKDRKLGFVSARLSEEFKNMLISIFLEGSAIQSFRRNLKHNHADAIACLVILALRGFT